MLFSSSLNNTGWWANSPRRRNTTNTKSTNTKLGTRPLKNLSRVGSFSMLLPLASALYLVFYKLMEKTIFRSYKLCLGYGIGKENRLNRVQHTLKNIFFFHQIFRLKHLRISRFVKIKYFTSWKCIDPWIPSQV